MFRFIMQTFHSISCNHIYHNTQDILALEI